MDKKTSNVIRMLKTTRILFNDNRSIWTKVEVLNLSVPLFLVAVDTIEDSTLSANKDVGYASVEKEIMREDIEDQAYVYSCALLSIANFNKDMEMSRAVNVSESTLSRLKDQDFIITVKQIGGYAVANADRLVGYGIEKEEIPTLLTKLDAFSKMQTAPRNEIINRKISKEQLVGLIDEAKEMLTSQIDLQMEVLRKKEPEFYNGYISARQVIGVGVRYAKDDKKSNK